MSKTESLPIRRMQSIADEVDRLNQRIMRRAYEIFEGRGNMFGLDLDNWLQAENETVWKPPIEMREKNNELVLNVALPGADPRQIEIDATTDDLIVKTEAHHEHRQEDGSVYACEFHCGGAFRAIHFPKEINPDKMKAEFKNGILSIRAPVSEAQRSRRVEIEAA